MLGIPAKANRALLCRDRFGHSFSVVILFHRGGKIAESFSSVNMKPVVTISYRLSHWCTSADDVSTWIEDTTEYFRLPELEGTSDEKKIFTSYDLYRDSVKGV